MEQSLLGRALASPQETLSLILVSCKLSGDSAYSLSNRAGEGRRTGCLRLGWREKNSVLSLQIWNPESRTPALVLKGRVLQRAPVALQIADTETVSPDQQVLGSIRDPVSKYQGGQSRSSQPRNPTAGVIATRWLQGREIPFLWVAVLTVPIGWPYSNVHMAALIRLSGLKKGGRDLNLKGDTLVEGARDVREREQGGRYD